MRVNVFIKHIQKKKKTVKRNVNKYLEFIFFSCFKIGFKNNINFSVYHVQINLNWMHAIKAGDPNCFGRKYQKIKNTHFMFQFFKKKKSKTKKNVFELWIHTTFNEFNGFGRTALWSSLSLLLLQFRNFRNCNCCCCSKFLGRCLLLARSHPRCKHINSCK